MRTGSPLVLCIILLCAAGAGCVFDGSGVAPRQSAHPDIVADGFSSSPLTEGPLVDGPLVDGPRIDARHLEAGVLRDQLRDRPIKDLPSTGDVRPWPDAPIKPDSGGCLVEDFSSGPGQVQPKTGRWVTSGGHLRQDLTGAGNYAVIAGVNASDYVVSAFVRVNSTFPKTGWVEGASVGVRLQPGTGLTPRQYLCGIYPGSSGLVIVHCSGGDPDKTCQVVRQTGPQIVTGQPVLVRATIVGTNLTCELPQSLAKTSWNTALSSGGPTLITQYADASYDNLQVCPP